MGRDGLGGNLFFLAKRGEISGPPARRGEMRGAVGGGREKEDGVVE